MKAADKAAVFFGLYKKAEALQMNHNGFLQAEQNLKPYAGF